MPSVDVFRLSPDNIVCGGKVTMDLEATFAGNDGGYVTVRIAGDNQCYFAIGSQKLSDRVTLQIPVRKGKGRLTQSVKCHEESEIVISLVATAEDATGVSGVPRRRRLTIGGCP